MAKGFKVIPKETEPKEEWDYFNAHSDTWALATECYPFALKVPAMMEVLQPFAAATWASVPLALRFANEKGHTEDLRLRRRLPHGPLVRTATGTPLYPIVTGSQELHCY